VSCLKLCTNFFGGNTSCVELTTANGDLLILDCGTGAHGLYGDADVWRASHIAAREIVQAPRKTA
jgi:hypothetical protein